MNVVEVKNMSKNFKNKKLFNNFSLEIEANTVHILLGFLLLFLISLRMLFFSLKYPLISVSGFKGAVQCLLWHLTINHYGYS